MSRDVDMPRAVAVLPREQQAWLERFVRYGVREAKLSDPDPEPGKGLRGFSSSRLASAMMASEALRKDSKVAVDQAEVLLRRSDPKKISPAIETDSVEIKAFIAASDAAYDAGLRNVARVVEYAVVKAVFDNNSSVHRAMSEAEHSPKLDAVLIKELVEMPIERIVLLNEAEAVDRAFMLMSYGAALYAEYFGVLVHLAGSTLFKEWIKYAPVVRSSWDLFRKGYVVLGTALPESVKDGEIEAGTTYVCAKLRDGDAAKGSTLMEIGD